MLFSDESKCNLVDFDGMRLITRPVNTRLDLKYYNTSVKHWGGSVMVWGCFSGNYVGPLHKIDGIMDRFVYRDILQNVMYPFADEETPIRWLYQHDNHPKHMAKVVKSWLQEHSVSVINLP